MHSNFDRYIVVLKRLGVILFIFFVCRILFLVFNYKIFASNSFFELMIAFIYGIRFDITTITISNIVFIVLHILPFPFFYNRKFQRFLLWLFYLANIPAIVFNCIDLVYFKFTGKRTTSDFFEMFALGNDIQNNILQYIIDFWFVPVIIILLVMLLIKSYKKITVPFPDSTKRSSLIEWLLLIPAVLIITVAFRGGVQYRPLSVLSASKYSNPQNASLILNTPFCIIKSFRQAELEEAEYMPLSEAEKICSVRKNYTGPVPFRPLNIVLIIMESFSREYIGGLNNYKSYTPFLDSLMNEGLIFTNAYANGKKSIEGIPAIVAGLPALQSDPFITSRYGANAFEAIPFLLRKKNYTTAFFHGGNNGTMGFDGFAKAAGFEKYFGRNEYPDQNNYDGNWGIYDEPFFQFFCVEMNNMPQPFMTCIFSLSSHHPYSIPEKYKGKFVTGSLPIMESISYADYSLKKFFETASKENWYKNTLFVITADHTGPAESARYSTRTGIYAVPILYFMPSDSLTGKPATVTQQIDIMPSLLDYLHYDQPFHAFGKSVFDITEGSYAVNYLNSTYQIISNDYSLIFDGEKISGLYKYKADTLLQSEVSLKYPSATDSLSHSLKAFIEVYNHRMINNLLNR